MQATNVWAVSIYRYHFAVLKWTRRELVNLDRATRAVLRASGSHQYGASLERLYHPRPDGGRGLSGLLEVREREVVSAATYLCGMNDPQLQGIVTYHTSGGRGEWSILKEANSVLLRRGLEFVIDERGVTDKNGDSDKSGRITRDLKIAQFDELLRVLQGKVIHGVFYTQCEDEVWDRSGSHAWLQDGRLRSQTEGLIVAMQDAV